MKLLNRLKIEHVALFSLLILFLIGNVQLIDDPDVWWHLKVGEDIIKTGQIPHIDNYTFSNLGHPWVAHEWLSEVLYALVYRAAGFYGLVGFNIFILSVTFMFLFVNLFRQAGKNMFWSVVFIIFTAVVLSNFWTFRPHMLAYLCFVTFLFIIEEYENGRNFLWILPLVMVFWVNVHGSFILGILLLAIYFVSNFKAFNWGRWRSVKLSSEKKKTFLFISLIVVLATLINPNFYEIWLYPFQTANSDIIVDNIQEWMPPNFHQARFQIFFVLFASVYFSLIVSKEKIRIYDGIILLLFTFLTMYGGRNMALFALACTPIAARHFNEIFFRRKFTQIPLLNGLILVGLLVMGIMWLPSSPDIEDYADPLNEPIGVVKFIQEKNLHGNIFNDYNWGGYLLWATFPENRVFIDGRTDMFADKVLPDYIKIIKGREDGYKILMNYRTDFVLIPRNFPLNELLKDKKEWTLIYQDSVAKLYQKGRPGDGK